VNYKSSYGFALSRPAFALAKLTTAIELLGEFLGAPVDLLINLYSVIPCKIVFLFSMRRLDLTSFT
jgi:hypothetical protein